MSDSEHRIRERAHQIWEQAGRPHHRSEEFWAQAEAELKRKAAEPDAVSNHTAAKKLAKSKKPSNAGAKDAPLGDPPPVAPAKTRTSAEHAVSAESQPAAPVKSKAEAKLTAKPKSKK